MLEELRACLKNIGLEHETAGDAHRVLATESNLHAFADFFRKHADLLHLVTAYKLHKFISDPSRSFTSAELNFYKAGLAEITMFFAQAYGDQEKLTQGKTNKTSP